MNNNEDEPFVPTKEHRETAASVRRMQRERLHQDLRGAPVEIPGAMREQFVRTPEEAGARAARISRALFEQEYKPDRTDEVQAIADKIVPEKMNRMIVAQALENCVKDDRGQPLVCYGCRNSFRGVSFPGEPTSGQFECISCIRYTLMLSTLDSVDPKQRMDRYIADDILEEIYKEWRKTQIDDIKKNVRQEVMDELAEEARIMSHNKINRIILRKH